MIYTPIDLKSGLWKTDPPVSVRQEAIVDAAVELNDGTILYLPVNDMGGINQNLATAIPIGSAEELASIQGGNNYPLGWYYVQYTDVDLSSVSPWIPLGTGRITEPFTGIYEGGGKTIRNVQVAGSTSSGLFGAIGRTGILRNLNVVNCTVNGGNNTGGLCGELKGIIRNCTVSGSISGQVHTGGIAGIMQETSEIIETFFFGFVDSNGKNYAGGIAGSIDSGTIRFSQNGGRIEGNDNIGGIVGGMKAKSASVVRCVNGGYVQGNKNTGGISGQSNGGTIDSCDNSGEIHGQDIAGGITGWASGASIYASRNTGIVQVSVETASGIAGYLGGGEIYASYNSGSISSSQYAGGIVGYYHETGKGKVAACYSTGKITTSYPAGIIGNNDSGSDRYVVHNTQISGCYWLKLQNGSTGLLGSVNPNTDENVKPFGSSYFPPAEPWPSVTVHVYWGVGDGSGPGKWWKDLGKWNGNNSIFPTLYWE
jgi:hypothetical protein